MMIFGKTPIVKFAAVIAIFAAMILSTGCATVNDFVASLKGKEDNPPLEKINSAPRYSDAANMKVPTDRQYKRMTKNRMEEESELQSNAGSTWVMEGQGSYLFAQNKMRREGDMLTVKLDGTAQKQVETKVSVIKKLLKQLEEQEKPQAPLSNGLAANGDANRAPAAAAAPAADAPKDDKEGLADVQAIPSKIVEKLADGNYRVKGQQPFMIGKREYKVILTGMLRPEDFNDEGITSTKLLDPQYDVVSIRRNAANE
ncbi:flagellar basal body L-ring protein FlgH [Bdellovibrio sp. SKB1291214]|uniref:flagellar basal body L-ring protein FlgH n=1 Tax=Bdellovibrio sp. SKB1291214 TaxID=1732569 RepID=UPI0020CCBA74|nr:flagellar basal body L-ring protein FlgH [Bdellovibrio sp. SKB1291214]UYL10116.1 flagellar basal body L-ring protein FlgH [Bdellovibrio sp. SKB1291214]